MSRPFLAALCLSVLALVPASAAPPRKALASKPVAQGFDPARLARLAQVMQGYVDRKELPGLVLRVVRDGRTVAHLELGHQDLAGEQPMRPDTIFRIASMSKAVTSVAALMLMEEGKLRLEDPLGMFLPEFKAPQVAVPGKEGEETRLVKATREITLRDLLTHRSGISYSFYGQGPVQAAYRRLGVTDGLEASDLSLAENSARLASAPLAQDPGKAFQYGLSTDILGRVVEVVSGRSLDAFLQERIFRPLKMQDTGFTVAKEKWPRFAGVATGAEAGGIREMRDPEGFGWVRLAPGAAYRPGQRYLSGGAGLVSTAPDYARFLQMLLNRGELEGARILSPKTVDLMTASATHDLPAIGAGKEFGLGVSVLVDLGAAGRLGTPGMYGWSGLYGTTFWVDPKERMVAVLMTQRYPYAGLDWIGAFQTQVYQALVR